MHNSLFVFNDEAEALALIQAADQYLKRFKLTNAIYSKYIINHGSSSSTAFLHKAIRNKLLLINTKVTPGKSSA